jgi:hypothetical protein
MKKSVYAEILDKIPNPLRSLIKSQPEDSLVKITNLMTELSSLNKKIGEFIETDKDSPLFGQQTTVLKNFLLFISRNKNDTFNGFYKRLESIVTGLSSNKSQKIADATSLEPQVKILYDKDNYLAFSIRTEEAQKKLCSEANWCINDKSFNTYASNAVQLNIINYNEPIGTAKYITGTTINFDSGEVTTASDYNNISIKKSSNLETHLLNNGYPDEVVDSIVSQMPGEILIKTVLYKIGDSKTGLLEFIEKMIASTYRQTATRSKNPVISKLNVDEIFEIMKPQIDKYLDETVVINLYKKYGILSLDSVRIFKLLLSNISEADKADIYSVTVSNFARIHKSAKLNISVLMPQLTKILAEEDQVKAELGISNSQVNEMVMAEPLTKPAPTKQPATKPKINPRPGPIPNKQPFKTPEPAKADAGDVIKRLNNLI